MSEIQYLEFKGQPIRTIMMDISSSGPEMWYVAADIAAQMGHKKTGNFTRLVSSKNLTHAEYETPGGVQLISVVSMAGIFEASSKSRSDFASMLRAQVDGLAVATIDRQVFPTPSNNLQVVPEPATGGQVVSLDDMERLAAAVMQAVGIAREQQARADRLEETLQVASSDLAAANRAVEVWTDGGAHHTMQQAAQWLASKGITVGRTRLYETLREMGWVCKGTTAPTQRAINSGWAAVEHARINEELKIMTRITTKGLDRLFRRMTAIEGTALALVKES